MMSRVKARTINTTATNSTASNSIMTTVQTQRAVENMNACVAENIGSVKSEVSNVLKAMRAWKKKFSTSSVKLNQATMWRKYGKTNTIPVERLDHDWPTKDLKLGHMFKTMFSGSDGRYAIGESLTQFSHLFPVKYEANNQANGWRIFVGEFEGDWVKSEHDSLFIDFVMECVFSHRLGGGRSPFERHDNTYNTRSINKFKTKWLKKGGFDVKEFAHVAALIIFILGEPQFRLYDSAVQATKLYAPCNGSAFLPKDPNATISPIVQVPVQNSTLPDLENEVETVEDVTPLIAEDVDNWEDLIDDDFEEKQAEEQVEIPPVTTPVIYDEEEEEEKKPDGWDLPDLPDEKKPKRKRNRNRPGKKERAAMKKA